MPTVGQKAPDFTLVGTDLKPIQLADYKGKNVVLLFFPLAYTSVCTTEMCMARDDQSQYAELNAEVIGVSVDSPFVLKKFAEENKLNFPLGSDFNKNVAEAYDTLFEGDFLGMSRFAKRSAFVIDREGILQYAEITDGKSLPDFEKIRTVLSTI
ncbi:MAG: redoxin domain-containing protein [Saprospiraceae bacterium]|nr:redoxin domain-containing protein [Saprospiraceae bacterium]